ncbi:amidohydrolase family protein [Ottowia thiooxydans]|uniref:Aminocarboxymuconate-semialdehyde decarboxylase n=1 Tax=Ottowia thiooxydans TaxID=219182 RepID=A0ABV2QGV9_9BURK
MTVIDVHTHMFTHKWMELLKANAGMYNVKTRPDGQNEIFRGDTPVVIPQKGHFDWKLRIQHMDQAGIDVSVVSLTCPNVYWGGEAISLQAAVEANDNVADAQREYPDRIRWFASLPWEYPQRAVEELERACAKGAAGVMVLANVAGKSLTDPMFAPIWKAIDDKALPVLVHPTDPPGVDAMDMTKFDLSWSVGFMFDTTLAITRMIFEGFFDQYPHLKIIASHGGGTLPYLVGRFEKGDEVELPQRRQMKRKPTDYLRHIYYDNITYNLNTMKYLVSVVGEEHVMLGTDWPHWVHDTAGALAHTAQLPPSQMRAIRGTNALRVFGL